MKYYGGISWKVYGIIDITMLFFDKDSFLEYLRILDMNGIHFPEIYIKTT